MNIFLAFFIGIVKGLSLGLSPVQTVIQGKVESKGVNSRENRERAEP